MAIKRFKHFQQVLVLKCKRCKHWQGIATTRTQEQLNDENEQKILKRKKIICTFCHREGQLIDNFFIKGVASNQEAKNIIKEGNLNEAINNDTLDLSFK